jgi:hypothetical protein
MIGFLGGLAKKARSATKSQKTSSERKTNVARSRTLTAFPSSPKLAFVLRVLDGAPERDLPELVEGVSRR